MGGELGTRLRDEPGIVGMTIVLNPVDPADPVILSKKILFASTSSRQASWSLHWCRHEQQ